MLPMPSEMIWLVRPFLWGSFGHILLQTLTTELVRPFLPNGCLMTTFLQRAVQTRMGDLRQAQLFCTRSHWVCLGFCTILPVDLAHFSRSHDRITRPCNLSALIQQALCRKRNSPSI